MKKLPIKAPKETGWLASNSKELDKTWQWRAQGGVMYYPADMETRHLFLALRMIWNHTMPVDMRVPRKFQTYSFDAFYTREYMFQGIRAMTTELGTRDDMSDEHKHQLGLIIAHLKVWQIVKHYGMDEEKRSEWWSGKSKAVITEFLNGEWEPLEVPVIGLVEISPEVQSAQPTEIERLKRVIEIKQDALEKALEHLEYCGWGDEWEREGAREQGLEELIDTALKVTPETVQMP